MRRLGVCGLFSPWTGEAVVDGELAPALLPFTAVHELMHLTGIADEGAANAAAYARCLAAGGPFADSARLWALRYAEVGLREADPRACRAAMERMNGRLRRAYIPLSGPRRSAAAGLARLLGLADFTESYGELPARIIEKGGP